MSVIGLATGGVMGSSRDQHANLAARPGKLLARLDRTDVEVFLRGQLALD